MSWGEIKKIVNSDFKHPLNKRMEWYEGLHPRNQIPRTVNKTTTLTAGMTAVDGYTVSEQFLNITSVGYLTEVKSYAHNGSASNTGTITTTEILIDKGYPTERRMVVLGGGDVNSGTGVLNIDLSKEWANADPNDDISVNMNQTISVNYPIQFNHSVVATHTATLPRTYQTTRTATLTISYVLSEDDVKENAL